MKFCVYFRFHSTSVCRPKNTNICLCVSVWLVNTTYLDLNSVVEADKNQTYTCQLNAKHKQTKQLKVNVSAQNHSIVILQMPNSTRISVSAECKSCALITVTTTTIHTNNHSNNVVDKCNHKIVVALSLEFFINSPEDGKNI